MSSFIQIIIPYSQTRYPSKSPVFKSHTTQSATTLSSMQSTLNSLQGGRCSFIFPILFVHTTIPTVSNKILFLYFIQFSPLCFTLTWSQNHPYNLNQHSFPLHLDNFSPSNNLYQKYFHHLSHLVNSGWVKRPGN